MVRASATRDDAIPNLVDLDVPVLAEKGGHIAWADPVVRVEAMVESVPRITHVVMNHQEGAAGCHGIDQCMLRVVMRGVTQRWVLRGHEVETVGRQSRIEQPSVDPGDAHARLGRA